MSKLKLFTIAMILVLVALASFKVMNYLFYFAVMSVLLTVYTCLTVKILKKG